MRKFGVFVMVLALSQIALYAYTRHSGALVTVYFDPRIGVDAVLRSRSWPSFAEWITALWLLFVGACTAITRKALLLYVTSEVVLLGVNVWFFAMVWHTNLSPAHGFSRNELFYPVITSLLFSGIPLSAALRVHLRRRN